MNKTLHESDRINFLPDWYVQADRRRRASRRQIFLAAIMIAGMVLLHSNQAYHVNELSTYYGTLRHQIDTTQEQVTEMVKLQRARDQLGKQYSIYQELAQPVSISQIVGTLAHLVPQTICLHELRATVDRVRVENPISDEAQTKGKSRRAALKEQSVVRTRPVVALRLKGSAPSNVDIANLVGKLASSNLFRNVKMIHSEQGRIGNAITRDFQLMMEVRLDCNYLNRTVEEVAHVD